MLRDGCMLADSHNRAVAGGAAGSNAGNRKARAWSCPHALCLLGGEETVRNMCCDLVQVHLLQLLACIFLHFPRVLDPVQVRKSADCPMSMIRHGQRSVPTSRATLQLGTFFSEHGCAKHRAYSHAERAKWLVDAGQVLVGSSSVPVSAASPRLGHRENTEELLEES